MTYQEIGDELNISKQAVSQLIKKGVNKIYKYMFQANIVQTPFEAIQAITMFFNIDNHDDFKQMFKLFDNNIKKEITTDEEWKKYN